MNSIKSYKYHVLDGTALYYNGGVYGLYSYVFSFLKKFRDAEFYVAFDYGKSHKKMFDANYKRRDLTEKQKEERNILFENYPLYIKILDNVVPCFYYKGYEADELIYNLIWVLKHDGVKDVFCVHSIDSDLYQLLLTGEVVFYNFKKKKVLTLNNFKKVVKMDIKEFIIKKILTGDRADNIKGILTEKEFESFVLGDKEVINKVFENYKQLYRNMMLYILSPAPVLLDYIKAKLSTWKSDVIKFRQMIIKNKLKILIDFI